MVTHSNNRSVCELVHLVHNVDVLVTPHGFQTMLLLFLPLPAIVFEVFPYRYFKNCYQKLSGDYGENEVSFFTYVYTYIHTWCMYTCELQALIAAVWLGILYGDSMSPPTSWHSALFLPYLSAQDSAGRVQFTPYCPLCREYSRAHDVMYVFTCTYVRKLCILLLIFPFAAIFFALWTICTVCIAHNKR